MYCASFGGDITLFCVKMDLGSCGRFTSHWKCGLTSTSPLYSAEAPARISHFLYVKVNSDPEADSVLSPEAFGRGSCVHGGFGKNFLFFPDEGGLVHTFF